MSKIFKRTAFIVIVIVLFSLIPLSSVEADPPDYTLTSTTGEWTAVTGGSGHIGLNTNEVRWGSASSADKKSGLRFVGESNVTFDEGATFIIGTLTHINYPIGSGTAANGATLKITLVFNTPAISPDPTFDFEFDIEETPNISGSCPTWQESSTPCDDKITFPISYGSEIFTIEDKKYTLKIEGFQTGGGDPLPHFITEEGKENSAYLIGTLSSVLIEEPQISVTKKTNDIDVTEAPGSYLVVGDPVSWQYSVQNTGNVELTGITAEDNVVGTITCPKTTLAPGELMTCTPKSGTVSLGQYENTVTVTGSHATGTVTNDDTSWYFGINPDITVTKTANPTSVPETGGTVTFTYTVTNTGTVPVTITSLTDDKFGALTGDDDCKVNTELSAGSDCSFTDSFSIPPGSPSTSHVNTFTAIAKDDQDNEVTASDTATVTYTDVKPDITVTKTASPTSVPEMGGTVTFTYTVTNTGTVPATITSLTDNKFGTLTGDNDCKANTVLAASSSCSFTDSFSIPPGSPSTSHVNTFTAIAKDDQDNEVTASDTATVTYTDVKPDIVVTKTANPTSVPETGGTVTFTFKVTNTGTVPVTITSLTDDKFGTGTNLDLDGDIDCQVGTALAVGASCEFEASFLIPPGTPSTTHVNTFTAHAEDAQKNDTSDSDTASVSYTDVLPDITVSKSANPTSVPETGGTVTFTYTVTNTGTVPATITSLTDDKFGTGTNLNLDGDTDCQVGTALAVGVSCEFEASFSIPPGTPSTTHVNEFTTIAKDAQDNEATASDTATVTYTEVSKSISVTKSVWNGTEYIDANDVGSGPDLPSSFNPVKFQFIVTNTGAAPLTGLSLSDSDMTTDFYESDFQTICNIPDSLEKDDSFTCYGNLPWAAGQHANTATATGTYGTTTVSDTDPAYYFGVDPKISLTKSSDPAVAFTATGQTIAYTFEATNTGNVTLTNVTITDPLTGLSALTCTPVAGSTLEPTESITCTATYTTDQDDVDAGILNNTATAAGTDPQQNEVTDTDSVSLEGPKQGASISLDKSPNPEVYTKVGDTITYTFTVTNDGIFTLFDLVLTDDLEGLSGLTCTPSGEPDIGDPILPTSAESRAVEPEPPNKSELDTLEPGQEWVCTATYTISQEDINRGQVTNTARVIGFTQSEEEVFDEDDALVEGPKDEASLHLTKTADPTTYKKVGDSITYTFTVTNNGIYTMTNVTVTDPLFGLSLGPIAEMAPGESKTYKYTYIITQADLEAKAIYNVATATGLDPQENEISVTDNETVDRLLPSKPQPKELPATGFAPNMVTVIPAQPAEKAYAQYSGFWIEIPRLGIKSDIVGVPVTGAEWDVTWLDDQIGWLEGTAFPTWPGTATLTGHVWNAFDQPGPFVNLHDLKWGDKIIIHLYGSSYTYEVRTSQTVLPSNMQPLNQDQDYSWLSLVTCRGFNETKQAYAYRLIVSAVLVDVK